MLAACWAGEAGRMVGGNSLLVLRTYRALSAPCFLGFFLLNLVSDARPNITGPTFRHSVGCLARSGIT